MTGSTQPDPQLWFHRLATQYVEAQILYHLNQVGVFQALDGGEPQAADAIAAGRGLDAKLLETLLDYVSQIDHLLVKDESGRYSLSEFGSAVIDRFSRQSNGKRTINMFDVRVGCYGPVWGALDSLLRQEARYGEDIRRNGEIATGAVHTLSGKLWPALDSAIHDVGAGWAVELGVSTALLDEIAGCNDEIDLYGVDRDPEALRAARGRAQAADAKRVSWITGDVTEPGDWAGSIDGNGPGLFYSVHFHEFLAQPIPRLQAALRELGARFPRAHVLAFEQPRLQEATRDDSDESLWLYAQSNVLIHHTIGNGRILPDEEWKTVFEQAGCRVASTEPVDYLGYKAYLFQL
jgi:hypothetical protein